MFFDSVAVLVLTFFAALGMVEVSEWLLKNPFKKKIKYNFFVVAKINSVPEEDIEPAVLSLIAETNGKKRRVFLDCEGISDRALSICQKLERRLDCYLCRGEDEILSMFTEGLHEEEKKL